MLYIFHVSLLQITLENILKPTIRVPFGHVSGESKANENKVSGDTIAFIDDFSAFLNTRWSETFTLEDQGVHYAYMILQCLHGLVTLLADHAEEYPINILNKFFKIVLTILAYFPFEIDGTPSEKQAWSKCNLISVELISKVGCISGINIRNFDQYEKAARDFLLSSRTFKLFVSEHQVIIQFILTGW